MAETMPLGAGWWRRFFGFCYEGLSLAVILLALQGLYQFLFQFSTGQAASALSSHETARNLNFVWLALGSFIWFAYCWRRGQTLAMKAWRMRLVGSQGEKPAWLAIVLRFMLGCLFYLPLIPAWILVWHHSWPFFAAGIASLWFVIPFGWALLDRRQLLLHDRLARTQLVLTQSSQPQNSAK